MNGSYGDYYTTKGQGSQEAYDAYYDDYGTSSVWEQINRDTLLNISGYRGGGYYQPFTSTHDSIQEALGEIETKENNWHLFILAILLFRFL